MIDIKPASMYYLPGQLTFSAEFETMTKQDDSRDLAVINQRIADEQSKSLMTANGEDDLAMILGNGLLLETHTFTGTPAEIWKQVAALSTEKTVTGSTVLNIPIMLADFYCHQVDVANADTGEVKRCIRTVLIDNEGKSYAFVSEGIARSLVRLCQVFGQHHYEPPIAIKVVQIPVRGQYRTFAIVPA